MSRGCQDPARALFYDRLGQFYERTELPGEAPNASISVGTCSLCGATEVEIHDAKRGVGPCRAQASMTQKRHSPAEGQMPVYGVPTKMPGPTRPNGASAIAGEGTYVLIEPDVTTYVGNVVAYRPLPNWVQAVRGKGAPGLQDLVERCMRGGNQPCLLVAFGKKGDMPMRIATSSTEIVINGAASPVRLDRARLSEIVAMIDRHGLPAVKKAVEVKDAMTRLGAGERFADLKKRYPGLASEMPRVPGSGEPERQMAFAMAERKARAAEEGTDT